MVNDAIHSYGRPASTKAERRAARAKVATYHQAQLGELVDHVAAAVDDYRNGNRDASEVDEVIFQYSRAARELWKFCTLMNVEIAARIISDEPAEDWWERGTRRRR